MDSSALHAIARALGVSDQDATRCAACGPSPFGAAGPRRRQLGANFTDFDLLQDPDAPDVCHGCVRLMGGRPGDNPPPLRTVSVRVAASEMQQLDAAAWWRLLSGTDVVSVDGEVLSWATSRKRHHWLRAGISTPETWRVGADDGTIVWAPDGGVLAAALLRLREIGATKGAILGGIYPPRLRAEHLDVIQDAEAVIAPYRDQLILDLAVWAAPTIPRQDQQQPEEREAVIDPVDAAAAHLVAEIVWGSEVRATDGKQFWAGYLLRRLRRFSRLPLATCVSRLIGECRVSPQSAAQATVILGRHTDEEVSAIEHALRERTDLIHALAFERMHKLRSERSREAR